MVLQTQIVAIALAIAIGACARAPDRGPVVLMRQLECPTTTVAMTVPTATCTPDQLTRIESKIASDPGLELFTMRIATPLERKGAVVIMHGGGSGGSASFDLQGASLMRSLACAGFDAYAFDARGFGGSTMPPSLQAPADANAPAVRAIDAARDLDAIIRHAIATSSVAKVNLIGWSWGSDVSGLYAGTHPEKIDRLILLAPVFDRRWPARHIETGAWREEKRDEVVKFFAPEREERAIFDASVASMYRFATTGVVRLPNGPYRDLYGADAPVWDPTKLRSPVLIIRGDQDKASLDAHALSLFGQLRTEKRYLVLGGLGHFLFRERGHRQTFEAINTFLRP